jgi:hypothetical protein
MQQMLKLLQLILFERRDLLALFMQPEIHVVECRKFLSFKIYETAVSLDIGKKYIIWWMVFPLFSWDNQIKWK